MPAKKARSEADRPLTEKQRLFAECVALQGMNYSDAYRASFCAEKMGAASVRVSACRLAAKPNIRLTIDRLRGVKETSSIASSLSDKERVLTKLRDLLDNAQGKPAEHVMLKAAALLGQTQGMYKDVVIEEQAETSDDIRAALEARLEALAAAGIVVDEDERGADALH